MLTQKAIDRLLAVKKHILEEPRRFDMGFIRSLQSSAPCGTTCCIAGWLIKLEYPYRQPSTVNGEEMFWEKDGDLCGDIMEASDLIGRNWSPLFNESHWPEDIKTAYREATTPAAQAQAGANAIDAFIAANGNWGE